VRRLFFQAAALPRFARERLNRVAMLLVVGFALAGCFSPRQPACAFSCAADGLCPAGYSCGTDGVCHRDDDPGTCDIPPQVDAAQDTLQETLDAGGDAQADAGN
jgi:hypothetical protein